MMQAVTEGRLVVACTFLGDSGRKPHTGVKTIVLLY